MRAKLPLVWIFVAWTLWGVWSIQQTWLAAIAAGQPPVARVNPWQLTIASAWFWALMTPLVMWNARLIRDRVSWAPGRVLAHIGSFVVLHLIDVTVYTVASAVIASRPRAIPPLLVSMGTFNALAYTAIVFIISSLDSQHALRARRTREQQLETQLAQAQLHALRAQLHPHFLFNSLNAIASLIHSDPKRADRMLAMLSELLRIAVDTAPRSEVPLTEEIEFARRYLEIERMRYGDRLDVRINVNGTAGQALVPNMLLQPLLENAVRHGIAPHARPGRVELEVDRTSNELFVLIRDTGGGFDPDQPPGVGLSTTRQRLEKLYGSAQRLVFETVPGGFEARISLPFRRFAEDAVS